MSPAASGLLRALIARSGVSRNRILLSDAQSVDWRSLTFTGERHQLSLRVIGPDAMTAVELMSADLEDCEFSISGVIVADVHVCGAIDQAPDGSICLTVEALTVSED
jgi:hypothetical protein